MSDKYSLFNALIKGESKGILEIYETVFPIALKHISRNKGNKDDAEDIFQKALIMIITKFKVKNYEPIENFESYLLGICKNLWLKELSFRKKWVTKTQNSELNNEGNAKMLALAILENDRWEAYKRNFNLLSDNCKKVLSLYFKKKSYAEITAALQYNSETVTRQRVFKCKTKLTQLIQVDPNYKKLKKL